MHIQTLWNRSQAILISAQLTGFSHHLRMDITACTIAASARVSFCDGFLRIFVHATGVWPTLSVVSLLGDRGEFIARDKVPATFGGKQICSLQHLRRTSNSKTTDLPPLKHICIFNIFYPSFIWCFWLSHDFISVPSVTEYDIMFSYKTENDAQNTAEKYPLIRNLHLQTVVMIQCMKLMSVLSLI